MQRAARSVLVRLCLLAFAPHVLACPRATAPKEASRPPIAVTDEGQPLVFTVGEVATALPYGFVTFGEGAVTVTITEKPSDCATLRRDFGMALSFQLPSGPGGRFYDHARIGTYADFGDFTRPLPLDHVPPYDAAVKVDEVQLRSGGLARGTFEMDVMGPAPGSPKEKVHYTAKGAWRAKLCEVGDYQLATVHDPLPEDDVKTPVTARIPNEPLFEVKSAFVVELKTWNHLEPFVDRLELYDVAGLDCESRRGARKNAHALVFSWIGGVAADHLLPGPQPANASYKPPGSPETIGYDFAQSRAWVRFDQVSFVAGAQVTGAVGARSGMRQPEERNAEAHGTFTAIVCHGQPGEP